MGYWFQTRDELAKFENLSGNWYNRDYEDGTYLPNEWDGTCGDDAKFGYVVGGKDAKMGAYPFIAAIGNKNRQPYF